MNLQANVEMMVDQIEHVWIPMPDGCRLAARLWIPKAALDAPAPAVFEYIPYRKADMTRARDERNHPAFAANGIASLRVEMRGSGDSEGHMPDMYAPNELNDAHHVIDWIAQQPWCNGAVGMFGTSWGGTASLQANLKAHPALKAIIAVCATHDRYEDDIHHKGGCLLTDSIEWGVTLPAILASPPTPDAGPDWQALWRDRLENLTSPLETWIREEARGSYWRRGSVTHAADDLTCPILAIGGWSDRYSNSVMSLAEKRPDLVWGIVGPWGHHYPDQAHPGPGIDFQTVALEWWQHWLQDTPPAALGWPKLQVWLREFDAPLNALDQRNGRWIETKRPSEETAPLTFHLSDNSGLGSVPGKGPWTVPHDLRVGAQSGDTGYFGRFGGLPLDQQGDDRRSLTFETPPLEQDIILYGSAQITLEVSTSTPLSQLAMRLNDVTPQGNVARVGVAMRNAALDDALDAPDGSPSAGTKTLHIPFHTKAYRFSKGHRIRLSVSASYWPLIWPAPEAANMSVQRGELTLPVFEATPNDVARPLPVPSETPALASYDVLGAPDLIRFLQDIGDTKLCSGWHQPFSSVHYRETGTTFGFETCAENRIDPASPLSASSHYTHRMVFERPDGTANVQSSLTVTCDAEAYYISAKLTADWDDTEIAKRVWDTRIERRLS